MSETEHPSNEYLHGNFIFEATFSMKRFLMSDEIGTLDVGQVLILTRHLLHIIWPFC